MTFQSILFGKNIDKLRKNSPEAPPFFVDLNLDQIVDAITEGKQEYNLKPFFYVTLKDIDSIMYRHEIMKDLENPILLKAIESFSQKMHFVRQNLSNIKKIYYIQQKRRWLLDTVYIYCEAVGCLQSDLSSIDIKSKKLLSFIKYLKKYVESNSFISICSETKNLKDELSNIKYTICIKDGSFTVSKYDSEIDYNTDVEKTFANFKHGSGKSYRINFYNSTNMNHIEAKILDFVSQLYPELFYDLVDYCARYNDFIDKTIAEFDREIQFFVAYLEYTQRFKEMGLSFCYPHISNTCKDIYASEAFDLSLANKLISTNSSVVCNDFYLKDEERIFVVSGPNQGGKTTFARTFGQMHYLASLGCPVPGRAAKLFLFDRLFTHFEREENIKTLRGKLQDELARIYDILNIATSNSIIIMNEIFTSTTLKDAVVLSKRIIEKIIELDLLCVWVTFIDELASLGNQTVSMVSTIVPENPSKRTYKIIRKPADGLSYAMSIAEKYRVTYLHIKDRMRL